MDIKNYISSGVIEAYVLGTISQEESSILECVMKNNSNVQAAVTEYQEILEDFATKTAIAPPAQIKMELLKKIAISTTPEIVGKIIPLPAKITEEKIAPTIPTWMKAASVAVLFGLGYLGYEVNSKNTQLQEIAKNNIELSTKVASLEQMNSMMKNSLRIELKGVPNHPNMLADVYWHTSKKVFLEMKNLPVAPIGKQYQLWAIVDGKPVDMGIYSAKKDSAVQEMKSVNNAQAFAITLEKEGGNKTPTMEEMYVMGAI